ncbi:CPBP family intramembrane glutamic endopeptidase [Noviherbaspirillum galbum]|uniref:CPBP family intramembrane metalloprotease n=1 Tax=Noviherbaspirillum galbum TaxID=2709383 RepID=A0A6B3SY75_9BURK|nr:CPBP family intramembrane glutamic endopeptidase [Noviherbaspirillum galbum]NEX64645.1 CPBP family intramembrane metalloprotease [Noviherbaspirillum galbum]
MMKEYTDRHPVQTALLCVGLQFMLTWIILVAGRGMAPPAEFGKVKLVAFASTIVLPLVLVQVLGLWKRIGLELNRIRPEPVALAALVPCAVYLLAGVRGGTEQLAGDATLQFFNAFGEEMLFRGVIFALLLQLPRWQALILGGLLFGGMHLMHGFMGASWSDAFRQAGLTAITGTMFTAVRFRSGSLWLVILIHMVVNMCKLYSNVRDAEAGSPLPLLVWFEYLFQIGIVIYVIFSERGKLGWSFAGRPMARREDALTT